MGKAVFSSGAKRDTLYSSIIQAKSLMACFFSAEVEKEISFCEAMQPLNIFDELFRFQAVLVEVMQSSFGAHLQRLQVPRHILQHSGFIIYDEFLR